MTWDIMIPVPPETVTRSHKSWSLAKSVQWIAARIGGVRARNGEIIWVLTTLPMTEVSMAQCFELYRVRWQVELVFKRLKSLLHFDALPSRQGPTARSWILGRLLAAAIAQQLLTPSGDFSPWGYPLGE
jgi:IS4 transposase